MVRWSDNYYGGDSSIVQPALMGVDTINSTGYAFAAALKGGTTMTWVRDGYNGYWISMQPALVGVNQIYSTHTEYAAFAAVFKGGILVMWNHKDYATGVCRQRVC